MQQWVLLFWNKLQQRLALRHTHCHWLVFQYSVTKSFGEVNHLSLLHLQICKINQTFEEKPKNHYCCPITATLPNHQYNPLLPLMAIMTCHFFLKTNLCNILHHQSVQLCKNGIFYYVRNKKNRCNLAINMHDMIGNIYFDSCHNYLTLWSM